MSAGGVNAITRFRTPTRRVGQQPYCTATGRAVWRTKATAITADAARQMITAFAAAYRGSGLDHNTATYAHDDTDSRVVVTGARDAWNVIGINADDGTGIHAVIRCECHAREVAQHLNAIMFVGRAPGSAPTR